jgi:4,5-DOPA dioxygenase extradiol
MKKPMPAVFFGHGNPMNALEINDYSKGWARFGKDIPRPKAILSISAHWYVPGTLVSVTDAPRTIHDFGGFPQELYEVTYPAPGDPELARRVQDILAPTTVARDVQWGLDHGTWSVLCHVYPKADVPVIQLSIDDTQPPEYHYEIGKRLAPLRDENVLIMGSGNVVHNLSAYAWGRPDVKPYDWAVRFENKIRALLLDAKDDLIINYEELGRDALLSAPSPDHYLPLLYVIALRRKGEQVSYPVEGIDGGAVSMLAVKVG